MARKELSVGELKWVLIVKPAGDDIGYLKNIAAFHPLVIESTEMPTRYPLIEDYGNYLFLIMHFPIISKINDVAEVDFLITGNTVVTIVFRYFKNLDDIFDEVEGNQDIQKKVANQHTGAMLYYIIDQLFYRLIGDLDTTEEKITTIEDKIFRRGGAKLVEEISRIKRDVLDFRRILIPQEEVLKLLPEKVEKFYGKQMKPYFMDIIVTESKIRNYLENQKETIEALHQTNESLMSNRISNIITILTIFSATILPINFIASIWGMNQRVMPLRDGPFDFWIIVSAMAGLVLLLIFIFKKNRWL